MPLPSLHPRPRQLLYNCQSASATVRPDASNIVGTRYEPSALGMQKGSPERRYRAPGRRAILSKKLTAICVRELTSAAFGPHLSKGQVTASICNDIWARKDRESQWNALDKSAFARLVATLVGEIMALCCDVSHEMSDDVIYEQAGVQALQCLTETIAQQWLRLSAAVAQYSGRNIVVVRDQFVARSILKHLSYL